MLNDFKTTQTATAMAITVNEALRLKNEISGLLRSVQEIASRSGFLVANSRLVFGELLEDGLKVEKQNGIAFEDYKDRYYALLNFSNKIHTEIARFNAEKNIGFLVRQRSNLLNVEALLNQAATESKPYDRTRSNYVEGVGRVEIQSTFVPYVSDETYVAEAREVRDAIRTIDNEISALNSGTIQLSFGFRDVDDIKAYFRL